MTAQPQLRTVSRSWPALLALLTSLALPQIRADQWFMKIEGAPGELTDGPRAGWTPVQIAGAVATRTADPATGELAPAAFSCEFRKAVGATSIQLLQSCATGEALPKVTFASIQSEPRATRYRITLERVFVTHVSQQGFTGEERSSLENEAVKLAFDKIETTAFELDANGSTIGGTAAQFDQTTRLGELKSRPAFRIQVTREAGVRGLTVQWPALSGHRYELLGCAALGQPWIRLATFSAENDGLASEVIPYELPMTFLRVEEID